MSTYTHISPFRHLSNICTHDNTFQKSCISLLGALTYCTALQQPCSFQKCEQMHLIRTVSACLGLTEISNQFGVIEYSQQRLVWSVNTVTHRECRASIFKNAQKNNPEENQGYCLRKHRSPAAFCFLASPSPSAQSLPAAACTHIKSFAHVQTRCSDHILPRSTRLCAGLTRPLSRSCCFPDHAVILPSIPPHWGHVKNINISQMPSRPWSTLVRTLHFLGKSCGDRNSL